MTRPVVSAILLCALGVMAAPLAGLASTPDEVAAARQASLDGILTTISAQAVAAQRLTCMFGEEPDRVIKARRAGEDFVPDAADTCVAVLVRTAHDGHLPDLFRNVLKQSGGDVAFADKLPLAIGNAALSGNGKVALGNGKEIHDLPPPLAFDAGFTAAYLKGDRRGEADDVGGQRDKLRLVTEACLAVRKDAGTCFSVGYVQGGLALAAGTSAP